MDPEQPGEYRRLREQFLKSDAFRLKNIIDYVDNISYVVNGNAEQLRATCAAANDRGYELFALDEHNDTPELRLTQSEIGRTLTNYVASSLASETYANRVAQRAEVRWPGTQTGHKERAAALRQASPHVLARLLRDEWLHGQLARVTATLSFDPLAVHFYIPVEHVTRDGTRRKPMTAIETAALDACVGRIEPSVFYADDCAAVGAMLTSLRSDLSQLLGTHFPKIEAAYWRIQEIEGQGKNRTT